MPTAWLECRSRGGPHGAGKVKSEYEEVNQNDSGRVQVEWEEYLG